MGIALLALLLVLPASHAWVCPPCGSTAVPYPLSTGDGCGDPAYKVRCAAATNSSTSSPTLMFDALNGTSYRITSISAATQRLVVAPAPLVEQGSRCVSEGRGGGVQLNASLPFNVSSSNTIMLLNCTSALLLSPLNCSSNSLCHVYANATGSTAAACAPLPLCCTFVAGGSSTSYSIRVSPQFCSAYRSFVGLDPAAQPPATWGRRLGLELQWATPREPLCRTQADCEDGANASCADDPLTPAARRCFCVPGLSWSPLAGACQLST